MDNILEIADNNRYKCTKCGGRIFKGDKMLREKSQGYRHSFTLNICPRCLVRVFCELNLPIDYMKLAKKQYLVENLTGEIQNGS